MPSLDDGIDRVWLDGSRDTEQVIGEAELGGSAEEVVWGSDTEAYAIVLGGEPGLEPDARRGARSFEARGGAHHPRDLEGTLVHRSRERRGLRARRPRAARRTTWSSPITRPAPRGSTLCRRATLAEVRVHPRQGLAALGARRARSLKDPGNQADSPRAVSDSPPLGLRPDFVSPSSRPRLRAPKRASPNDADPELDPGSTRGSDDARGGGCHREAGLPWRRSGHQPPRGRRHPRATRSCPCSPRAWSCRPRRPGACPRRRRACCGSSPVSWPCVTASSPWSCGIARS